MTCMFSDYECMSLPPPDANNNVQCRSPSDAVVNGIDTKLAWGSWYVTNGYNHQYDCFDCQILSFDFVKREPIKYEAVYNFIGVDGKLHWDDVIMHGEEETPGILTLKGHDSGFDDVQHWYFLMNYADTQMVYYCGDLQTWHFEGVLIMSKQKTLNPERIYEIGENLSLLGLSWDETCQLDPETGCKGAPKSEFYLQ